jgi:hypothetical protein
MSDPLTRTTVERRIDEESLAPWKARRYRTFHETLVGSSPAFPCFFAVDAHEAGDLRYLFPESPGESASEHVAEALRAYLEAAPDIAPVTSLVVLFEPPAGRRSAEWYEERFWRLLESLHRHDEASWPSSVPVDPESSQWAFSFAGEPLFLVARAPFYDDRRSRHTPHGLEVTVQPRWVFDGLSADTDRGERVRRTIRARLESYDTVPPHPDIGPYGDDDSREWHQYFLPKVGDDRRAAFPFEVDA